MINNQTKNPKISVVIPVYNAEKDIDRCMQSIYNQTFTDYEVILVNDGSADQSLAKCRAHAGKDPRVQVIDQENQGSGPARNAGIEAAKGEYIYFCDSDDEIAPNLLERVYAVAEETKVDLVVFSVHAKITDSKTGAVLREYDTAKEERLFPDCASFRQAFSKLYYEGVLFGAPYNKLFRTTVIRQNGVRFPELRRGQDEVFNMRYYRYTSSCKVIPDALYLYYQFDNQGRNKKYRLSYFQTTTKTYFQTLSGLLKEFEADDEYSKRKFQNSFVYSMESASLLAFNPVEKLSRKQKIEFITSVVSADFVRDIAKEIVFVPEGYERFWQLFSAQDAVGVYRQLARNIRVEKIKAPLRKIRDAIIKKK